MGVRVWINFLKKYREKIKSGVDELKWDILALYLARKDPRIPFRSKILIGLAVSYLMCPIDLIPDFIPVVGQLEDLVIVPALIGYAVKIIPPDVLREYREKAKVTFREGSPSYRRGLVIIVIVWVSILLLAIYLIGKAVGIIS
jgi:uncharacterized membrane protein YkvA (DUF1232 family)